jgi:hypothetical protein
VSEWDDYEEDGVLDLEDQLERVLDRAFPAKGTRMSFDEEGTTEAHERRIVRCRSCRAQIIWFKTAAGKNMPVDADTVKPEDTEYDPDEGHKSHFATCPNADQHRRRK